VNDFASLLNAYAGIRRVFFNGSDADTVFRRRVLPTLRMRESLLLTRLPSTSPANAGWSRAKKLDAWRVILAR
jgi:G:T/U-mismatch repair DNA glycosylase